MAIIKRTIVDRIEISRDGDAGVRVIFALVEDGEVLHTNVHRFSVPKGTDILTRAAEVNTHLVSMGKQPIPAKAITVINNTLTACWAAMDAP